MRLIYIDESGFSQNEPILVVAGVVVNADLQWKAIEKHVSELIEKYVPLECRYNFVFHASDLFHGTGRTVFDRRSFPLEGARTALKELLSIPSKFHLPVVCGWLRKSAVVAKIFTDGPKTKADQKHVRSINQSVAFSMCAVAAELYLRKCENPDEIATLHVENNTETRSWVKGMHDVLRGVCDPCTTALWASSMKIGPDVLPLNKIVDAVNFVEKGDAFLLQLADACAFFLRYFLEDKPNLGEFIDAFTQGRPEKLGAKKDPQRSAGGYALFEL